MPTPDFKKLVKSTNDLLLQNEVGREDHIQEFWRGIEWVEHRRQVLKTHAELSRTSDAFINLYPSLVQQPSPTLLILREFGIFIKAKGGKRAQSIWEKKLTTPDPEDFDLITRKLADPNVRAKSSNYDDVLATLPEKGHAITRLVAIHVFNALRLHHIPFADSVGVDIKTWGPTSEFATGKKYYSLLPLMAYVPRDVVDCYGWAFAEFVVNGCDCVIESSTRYAFKKVIRQVAQRSA